MQMSKFNYEKYRFKLFFETSRTEGLTFMIFIVHPQIAGIINKVWRTWTHGDAVSINED